MTSNEMLKNLLKEYEQKRIWAEEDLELRKQRLYASVPRLKEIEEELDFCAISTAKSILSSGLNLVSEFEKKIEALKKEKKEILSKLGMDLNYLSPNYECNICNDTGYVTLSDYRTDMCSCLKQRLLDISYNKANIGNVDTENFDSFNEKVFSNEVNFEKYNSKKSPRQNMLELKKIAMNFVQNFDDPQEKNLIFIGNTGLGKTFLSNCIANELLKKGKTVLYQTAPVLLDTVIDSKFSKNYRAGFNGVKSDFIDTVLNVDLLIIDDLGTESSNSMKISELFTIINTRLLNSNRKVTKTIISTNLNLKQIFTCYEERIGSRIAGYYNPCFFFGDDVRIFGKQFLKP